MVVEGTNIGDQFYTKMNWLISVCSLPMPALQVAVVAAELWLELEPALLLPAVAAVVVTELWLELEPALLLLAVAVAAGGRVRGAATAATPRRSPAPVGAAAAEVAKSMTTTMTSAELLRQLLLHFQSPQLPSRALPPPHQLQQLQQQQQQRLPFPFSAHFPFLLSQRASATVV